MTGFADLVLDASDMVGGRLLDVNRDITEGTSCKWEIDQITDHAGTAIDLTSATIVCKVVTDVDGSDVLTLTATGGVGILTISATSTDTAGLAVGATKTKARPCLWYCTVTSAGSKVQFWGPSGSNFRIYAA